MLTLKDLASTDDDDYFMTDVNTAKQTLFCNIYFAQTESQRAQSDSFKRSDLFSDGDWRIRCNFTPTWVEISVCCSRCVNSLNSAKGQRNLNKMFDPFWETVKILLTFHCGYYAMNESHVITFKL